MKLTHHKSAGTTYMFDSASVPERIGILATLAGGIVGAIAGIIRAARWVARVESQIEQSRVERSEFLDEIRAMREEVRGLRGDFTAAVLRLLGESKE